MVRPERTVSDGGSCCIELTGASPVAVSAEAPRSRPRAREEIPASEWGVKSPQRVVWPVGGEQVRRPSIKRTLQPREISTRKVGPAEPLMSRRRQQTAPGDRSGAGRPRGMEEGMRTQFDAEQERPVPAAKGEGLALTASGEGGPYKPTAKADRAGEGELCSPLRESEGFIVPKGRRRLPVTPVANAGRGKEPCFGYGRAWR
jgi:hypothetical protein